MYLSIGDIEQIRNYFTERPVKRAYLFGSLSRNEADKNSDVDILVELDHTKPIGMQFFTYQQELEDILHKKVDLITEEGLSVYIRPVIEKDKVLIYER